MKSILSGAAVLVAMSYMSSGASCLLPDHTRPDAVCVTSSPVIDLWTPPFEEHLQCSCADDPLCQAIYRGSVAKIHEDGWHADLVFEKASKDANRKLSYWIVSAPEGPSCRHINADGQQKLDYEVIHTGTTVPSADGTSFEIKDVPIWPDQATYDAAAAGATRRLAVITSGYESQGQPRWYQPHPLTFVKTCPRCAAPPCPLRTWPLLVDSGGAELNGLGVNPVGTDGEPIVAGQTKGVLHLGRDNDKNVSGDSDGDIFLGSLQSNGTATWARSFPGPEEQLVGGLAVGAEGNIVLGGSFRKQVDFGGGPLVQTSFSHDLFVASLGAAGEHRWSRHFGSIANHQTNAVALHEDGTIALAGEYDNRPDSLLAFDNFTLPSGGASHSDDGFIALFAPDTGLTRWAIALGSAPGVERVNSVAFVPPYMSVTGGATGTDAAPYVVAAAGSFQRVLPLPGVAPLTSDGSSDAFVVVIDSTSTVRSAFRLGVGPMQDAAASAVVSRPDGDLVVAGTFKGKVALSDSIHLESAGGQDIFVVELNPKGEVVWASRLGGPEDDKVGDLAMAPDQSVVLVGTVRGRGQIKVDEWSLDARGDEDALVVKLAPPGSSYWKHAGQVMWASRFGGGARTDGTRALVRADGRVLVGGTYEGEWQLGDAQFHAGGGQNVFVIELAP